LLLTQIRDFQSFQGSEDGVPQFYTDYWAHILELSQIELERKSIGLEKLSPHAEIEDEADKMLNSMILVDLTQLESQIQKELLTNPSYAKEF